MFGGEFRVLELAGSATDRGETHGRSLKTEIGLYLDERLRLSGEAEWSGRAARQEEIRAIAESTLRLHQAYDADLFEEMAAMAEAAGISAAEAVVVGGFTDLIDIIRTTGGTTAVEDDCTAVIDPRSGVLAQTWDMHASAGDYLVMFDLKPDNGPGALLQSTAGCLGQIGINEAGIAVGINNLTAWGRPGVTWPFAVRKALARPTVADAVEAIAGAPLAGGHNFLVLGPDGDGYDIEAMPGSVDVRRTSGKALFHTNHCLAEATVAEEAPRLQHFVESSRERLEVAMASSTGPIGRDTAMELFAHPTICRRAPTPDDVASCGAVIMEPRQRSMWAAWGYPDQAEYQLFSL